MRLVKAYRSKDEKRVVRVKHDTYFGDYLCEVTDEGNHNPAFNKYFEGVSQALMYAEHLSEYGVPIDTGEAYV